MRKNGYTSKREWKGNNYLHSKLDFLAADENEMPILII